MTTNWSSGSPKSLSESPSYSGSSLVHHLFRCTPNLFSSIFYWTFTTRLHHWLDGTTLLSTRRPGPVHHHHSDTRNSPFSQYTFKTPTLPGKVLVLLDSPPLTDNDSSDNRKSSHYTSLVCLWENSTRFVTGSRTTRMWLTRPRETQVVMSRVIELKLVSYGNGRKLSSCNIITRTVYVWLTLWLKAVNFVRKH